MAQDKNAPGLISWAEAYQSSQQVRLYGVPLSDRLSLREIVDPRANRAQSTLAMIRAFAFGEYCQRLPVAVPMLVWGPSKPPDASDKCADANDADERVWTVLATDETLYLDVSVGPLSTLLDEIGTRGIDGGLNIENPHFDNGRLCATIHVWAHISIFGKKIGFDERVNVCIPLQGCYTVWSVEIATLEACFRAPSDLCLKLCVGKWGLSKCWDACAHIPMIAQASTAPQSDSPCNCKQ